MKVALDEGLYDERISETLPYTFSEFQEEDEVFIAVPDVDYPRKSSWTAARRGILQV